MNNAANRFTNTLLEKEIKYRILAENRVLISIAGDNGKYDFQFIFGEDEKDVALKVFSLAKVQEEKLAEGYKLCSELNAKWRWVKFYIDSDNEITAEIDAVIEPMTTGDECFELLLRTLDIVDKSYPEMMRLIWN